MKLLTFEYQDKENWGFLVTEPCNNEPWVFNPALLSEKIELSVLPTSSLWISKAPFDRDWPEDMVSFLASGEKGMERLRELYQYLANALNGGSDIALLMEAGYPLSKIKIKAPIPRPQLCFGLVRNGTPFFRNNPDAINANIYPLGHNRTQGSVIGHENIIVLRENSNIWGHNVELGIVIGKKGRYIPPHKALDHVAGYVPINDACTDAYFNAINGTHKGWEMPEDTDWFHEATMSWCGKKADTMAPMGPYITTRDEVNNAYDLISYTRKNGIQRDRTYTGCYILGIERLIHWYSSFATLNPGDVLHLGTMGVDGLSGSTESVYGPGDEVEVEIEKLGKLKSRVVMEHIRDWRDKEDPSRKIHPSPEARRLLRNNQAEIGSIDDWDISQARHYWTLYANYREVKEYEGLETSRWPRILNTPVSSLGRNGTEVEIPPRATTLDIGIELACVIKKLAFRVDPKDAYDFILGYTPLISIADSSFKDTLVEPATPQEAGLPYIYGRWADNFNIILDKPVIHNPESIYQREMRLEVENTGKVTGSTSEYVLKLPEILEFITRYITMFPGDVITLGRIARQVTVPADELVSIGAAIKGTVESMPEISLRICKHISS